MNQLRPVLVSLEFDAITPTKRINKQIIEPKNNKTPKSPELTKSLQMINTEKTIARLKTKLRGKLNA